MSLTIYKASAGSGKTFTLTSEYLHLAFEDTSLYRNILAVTFTNKATEEMKSRILKELYLLSTTPKAADHSKSLMERFSLDEKQLMAKAKELLKNILHDYSAFSVSTIDKFFQKVIRAFSREIGINSNYNVELDAKLPVARATANMIQDLDKPENNDLLEWLISFSQAKIADGSNWDIFRNISSLGNELFKESFKSKAGLIKSKLEDKTFLYGFKKQLEETEITFKEHLQKTGTEAYELFDKHFLEVKDFAYGKSGIANFFTHCLSGNIPGIGARVMAGYNEPEKWYSKSSKRKVDIDACLADGLMTLLTGTIDYINENIPLYNAVKLLLKHFNQFGVLADLERRLIDYEKENNVMLIGNTTELLSRIIDNSDTPFIYEKTGTRFRHFMMDEFQDTSQLQWNNFKPLLLNSLSEGNKNLIVGDVKQSIYRFRNSDWQLLGHKVAEDIFPFQPAENILPTNWRSCSNIIRFNNSYFRLLAERTQNHFNQEYPNDESPLRLRIKEAYNDVQQQIPPHKKDDIGLVQWKYIEREEEEELTYAEMTLVEMTTVIKEAQDNGYQLKDIAILVRSAREGNMAAQHLLNVSQNQPETSNYRFDVISNEALILSGSDAIQLLICVLKMFDTPSDRINMVNIAQLLINLEIKSPNSISDMPFDTDIINQLHEIRFKPVEEIVSTLLTLLDIDKLEQELPYIQSFQDAVQEFLSHNTSDIHSFLEWWEETGSSKSVTAPQDQDAINIITVHKSKGLEFPVVIMPFMEMNFGNQGNRSNILWCSTEAKPLNEMAILPVNYCTDMEKSLFGDDFYEEKLNKFMDEINLTYVAFTRAKEALFICSELKEIKSPKNIAELSFQIWPFNTDCTDHNELALATNWDDETNTLRIGDWPKPESEKQTFNSLPLKSYPLNMNPNGLRLKLHARDFMTSPAFEDASMLDQGKVMHEVFERINTVEDLKKSFSQSVQEGKLKQEESDTLYTHFYPLITQDTIKDWFHEGNKVLTEQTIITENGHVYRPDRIVKNNDIITVIDYKFGEKEDSKYNKQVAKYISLISEIGYKNVQGYIWYVNMNKVEQV